MAEPHRARPARLLPRRQRGAVAIMAGLSIAVLVGFAGLALDLGRLYVNKSELQTAADACALAAAAELGCPAGATNCLQAAEAAGIFAAGRNSRDFQRTAIAIPAADVRFSTTLAPNNAYLSRAGGANVQSTFAMCIARTTGIVPWFMGVLGVGAQVVTSQGVASSQPSATICPSAPIGVCPKAGGAPYVAGEWLAANGSNNSNTALTAASGIAGTFHWIDYDPPAEGTNEVSRRLAGQERACEVRINGSVQEGGVKQGAKDAYNTRFGIYANGANAYTAATAPPDRTGYAYPTTTLAVGSNAFNDYRVRQSSGTPFQGSNGAGGTYRPTNGNGNAGNVNGNASSANIHQTAGTNARLITTPMLSACGSGSTNAAATIQGFGCMLMLNPMSNGANIPVYLQYLGNASAVGSPCSSGGAPGGPGGNGARVATLVQ